MPLSREELARGQRALTSLIGAKITGAIAVQGAVQFDVTHRGCDDDACTLTVPLEAIRFAYAESNQDDAPASRPS